MNQDDFQQWLNSYGHAWQKGDPDAILELFTENALYQEGPFETCMMGKHAIHQYWTEGAEKSQADIKFLAQPLAVDGNRGIAHWHSTFKRIPSNQRVELDGILVIEFAEDGRCKDLREWWHKRQRK